MGTSIDISNGRSFPYYRISKNNSKLNNLRYAAICQAARVRNGFSRIHLTFKLLFVFLPMFFKISMEKFPSGERKVLKRRTRRVCTCVFKVQLVFMMSREKNSDSVRQRLAENSHSCKMISRHETLAEEKGNLQSQCLSAGRFSCGRFSCGRF